MSLIRVLPDSVANRIAAGEVIERPASVVKELLENAIDAGATRISIAITQGGRSSIQVTDDGSGMDRDDALLCIEAHATSKIREDGDIERISTLGFRGEALPSIASVSRFNLQTRQADDVAGTEIVVDGGVLRDVRDCGCPPGSTVRVRQLFYNMPARRKFLRTKATEEGHVQETVLTTALGNPGIAFELRADGRAALQVGSTADTGTRIGMLLGRETFSSMLPVDYAEEEVRISGFVARPGLTRSSRREQRLFVNGRPAEAATLFSAIRDAYHTLVMRGRYPVAVLYLELPPDLVDVNVHPAKREVRFRDPRFVGQVAAAGIRRALQKLAWDAPAMAPRYVPPGTGEHAVPHVTTPPVSGVSPDGAPARALPSPVSAPETEETGTLFPLDDMGPDWKLPPAPTGVGTVRPPAVVPRHPDIQGVPVVDSDTFRSLRVVGVLRDLYLLAEGQNGLVLIDQHAAHERILFEKLLQLARDKDGTRQPLLLPVTVEMTPSEASDLGKHLDHFDQLGFSIESFGGNTFLVTALPAHFPHTDVAALLRDVLDDLRDSPGGVPRQDEVSIAKAACRHAVKAEDPLAPREIERLLADLSKTEMPYTCPHGRPVMINVSFAELEKRFGRRA